MTGRGIGGGGCGHSVDFGVAAGASITLAATWREVVTGRPLGGEGRPPPPPTDAGCKKVVRGGKVGGQGRCRFLTSIKISRENEAREYTHA